MVYINKRKGYFGIMKNKEVFYTKYSNTISVI